jgi:hypothetical protein
MKASQSQIENAILFFANKFGKEKNYKAIMDLKHGLPKVVEMIVYEMFLNKCYFYSYVLQCADNGEEFKQYELLFEYATELKENGKVIFETQ